MRHGFLALVLAALVLSGCNTFAGGGPSTPTVTAAPVPATPEPTVETTAQQPQEPPDLVPGVEPDGSVDGPRLAAAHASTLANTSFTVNQTVIERSREETLLARYRTTGRFSETPGRFTVRLEQFDRENGAVRRQVIERYGDGEAVYRSVTAGDNRTTERLRAVAPTALGYRTTLTNQGSLTRLFGLVRTTVDGQFTRDGTQYVRLRTPQPSSVPPLENITLVAVVSERGVVESYRVRYRVDRGDGPTAVSVSLSYTDLGATTVSRPAWVDNATGMGE